MGEKVAIVGATGFFGRYITALFQENKQEIVACSQHGGKICGINVDRVDLSQGNNLEHWIKNQKISSMIYLSSVVPDSLIGSNLEIFHQNLEMHLKILNLWKNQKFHLIYASSCSVYGPQSPSPWNENNVTLPDNYYSISKLIGELLFYKEYLNHQKNLTILRINAPYSFDPNRKTVINIFIENALSGKDLVLFGSGNRGQDYIYIKDIAQAFWIAYKMKIPGIYNIASGQTITMNELAGKIISLTGSNSNLTYSGTTDPLEHETVTIDITKAQDILGFSPTYTLTEGLMDCIKKYKNV
jgi:nucleoside-diphosphate-sugar epimerase